jgi:hypothetical protein
MQMYACVLLRNGQANGQLLRIFPATGVSYASKAFRKSPYPAFWGCNSNCRFANQAFRWNAKTNI